VRPKRARGSARRLPGHVWPPHGRRRSRRRTRVRDLASGERSCLAEAAPRGVPARPHSPAPKAEPTHPRRWPARRTANHQAGPGPLAGAPRGTAWPGRPSRGSGGSAPGRSPGTGRPPRPPPSRPPGRRRRSARGARTPIGRPWSRRSTCHRVDSQVPSALGDRRRHCMLKGRSKRRCGRTAARRPVQPLDGGGADGVGKLGQGGWDRG
jgi:hypothetical protein